MQKVTIIAISLLMLSLSSPLRAEVRWLLDFQEALALSRQEGKIVLADFTGSDWCGWCKKLKKEVFSKPQFEAWAEEQVILLELDFPRRKLQPAKYKHQNEYLAKKYRIKGYPTILFLGYDGSVIGKMGYMRGGASNWIARAESLIVRHRALEGAGAEPGEKSQTLRQRIDGFFEKYFH